MFTTAQCDEPVPTIVAENQNLVPDTTNATKPYVHSRWAKKWFSLSPEQRKEFIEKKKQWIASLEEMDSNAPQRGKYTEENGGAEGSKRRRHYFSSKCEARRKWKALSDEEKKEFQEFLMQKGEFKGLSTGPVPPFSMAKWHKMSADEQNENGRHCFNERRRHFGCSKRRRYCSSGHQVEGKNGELPGFASKWYSLTLE